jgi:hypothetical protein
MTRMRFAIVAWLSGVALLGGAAPRTRAVEALAAATLITPATMQAVDDGLNFLTEHQLDDGSFGTSGYARNVAVCGLGGMAFLASGSTPTRGRYAEPINRCIEYLLSQTTDAGFIAAPDATSRGPMYGMSPQPELRDALGLAVELIIGAQNTEGGWRYQPQPRDADVSVTVCQVMALRAARNAGITVPRETIDQAIAYIQGCQNEDGGFRYTLTEAYQPSRFARSAAGVVAFYNAGIYDSPELQRGLDYLEQFRPGAETAEQGGFYFYAQYYSAQAMWHAGGERWQQWYPAVRDELLSRQRADGSWTDAICAEYGTAMACIVLQVPNNYLPILQR